MPSLGVAAAAAAALEVEEEEVEEVEAELMLLWVLLVPVVEIVELVEVVEGVELVKLLKLAALAEMVELAAPVEFVRGVAEVKVVVALPVALSLSEEAASYSLFAITEALAANWDCCSAEALFVSVAALAAHELASTDASLARLAATLAQ
jgi:hypothetical protein